MAGALAQIAPPDHLCSIYETAEEREAIAMPFLRMGLERGEKCIYICDAAGGNAAREAMQAHGIDVEGELARGALVLSSREQAYLRHGAFDPQAMFAYWKQAARETRLQGFSALRGLGETDWLAGGAMPVQRWMEYESGLTEAATDCACALLCQYNRRLFPPEVVRDVIRTHPLLVYRGTLCRNMYYTPAAEFLGDNAGAREVERLLQHTLERETVESELHSHEAYLRQILDSVTDNFFALSADWRFTGMNAHAAAQMRRLGKEPERLIGKVLWEEFAEVPNEQALRRVMSERVAITDELYYAPLGEWLENHIYPSPDGGLINFQRNVTARKRTGSWEQAQEKVVASERRFRQLAEAIPHHVWTLQADGSISYSNRLSAEQLCKSRWAAVHPDDLKRVREAWQQVSATGAPYEVEQRMRGRDGGYRRFLCRAVAVHDADGRILEWFGTDTDVEARRQAEEAVTEARTALAHVNRALTMGELSASIAHELNQPLAAIVTNANACERWLGAPMPNIAEAVASVRRIGRDANRASDVIARIRGLLTRRPSQKADLRIDEILSDVSLLVQREAHANDVHMQVTSAAGLPAIFADRVQLQQVVLNLVINAIEAMSAAPGRRQLDLQAQPYGKDGVRVVVTDSGVGLHPRVVDRIFDPFFTTKTEGMGMGLAISRSIVEAHGGRLWAESDGPAGARFQFILPARIA